MISRFIELGHNVNTKWESVDRDSELFSKIALKGPINQNITR